MERAIHDPEATASFYHLHGPPESGAACRGLACFSARRRDPARWAEACSREASIYCLGLCHSGPAVAGQPARPHVRLAAAKPVLVENILAGGVRDLSVYRDRGGGLALEDARRMTAEALTQIVMDSQLRGRGGAGFPAARKWDAVRRAGENTIVVVNADEGDPGAFSDKALLEDDPFRVIEGAAIAAHAIGAREILIYVRCEYPDAHEILRQALTQIEATGWLAGLRLHLVGGKGSFVCGEETALLNAVEHRRPFARARPPFPYQHGYHGRPTLVQNVETLAAVPWIVRHGADAYRGLGPGGGVGTKLISLNSLFTQPGLVEVPFGISLREIVEEIGGGIGAASMRGLMIGGPLAGLLPPHVFDAPFTYEGLAQIGGAVGHGGMIAFDQDTPIRDIIHEVFRFGATESCGLCVPCHRGTAELDRAFAADDRAPITPARWNDLIAALHQTSLCGHGRGLAEFAHSIERYYPEELHACLRTELPQ